MINQVKLWFLNVPKNHVFSILLEQKDVATGRCVSHLFYSVAYPNDKVNEKNV